MKGKKIVFIFLFALFLGGLCFPQRTPAKDTVTVTFVTDYTDKAVTTVKKTIPKSTEITDFPNPVTPEGGEFKVWIEYDKEGKTYKPFDNRTVTEDLTLYAGFRSKKGYISLSFYSDGNFPNYRQSIVKEGESCTRFDNPTKEGVKFVTWYSEDINEIMDFDQAVTGGAKIYRAIFSNDYYGLWVGNVPVTDRNRDDVLFQDHSPGTISYTPPTSPGDPGTLTLKDATIPATRRYVSEEVAPNGITYYAKNGIYSTVPLKILLKGDNKIEGWTGDGDEIDRFEETYGIQSKKALTLTGDGSLEVAGGYSKYSYGIVGKGKITITGGTLKAEGTGKYEGKGIESEGGIEIAGANTQVIAKGISDDSSYGYGFLAIGNKGVQIKDKARVTAIGSKCGIYIPNFTDYPDAEVKAGADEGSARVQDVYTVDFENSKWVHIQPGKMWYDLWVSGIHIHEGNQGDILGDGKVSFTPKGKGGTLTLKNANIPGKKINPEYLYGAGGKIGAGIYSKFPLTIELQGDNHITPVDVENTDTYGIKVEGPLTLCGKGSLRAQSGESKYGLYSVSRGISTEELTIEEANIQAAAGKATYSCGLLGRRNIVLKNCQVNATGGESEKSSVGIRANYEMEIKNAQVHATGGKTQGESIGIWAEVCRIDFSTVTAEGKEAPESYGFYYSSTIKESTVIAAGKTESYRINPIVTYSIPPKIYGGEDENAPELSDVINYDIARIGQYKWTKIEPGEGYTLKVVDGEGSGTYQAGTEVTITANPPTGKTFEKWTVVSGTPTIDNVNNATAKLTMPAENVEIKAIYKDGTSPSTTYTVTFDSDGGSPTPANQSVEAGKKVAEPTGVTKAGYTLEGWYHGSTKWDFANDTVNSDLTLKAKWTKNIVNYTVTFDADGGSPTPAAVTVEEGKKVAEPAGVTKTGYTLEGWYHGSTKWDFANDTVNSDLTLKAKWIANQYTVTFDSDGGTAVAAATVDHGNPVAKPADPTKEGYAFAGWTLNGNPYDFTTPVTGDIILVATWQVKTYNVVFHALGGNPAPATQVVNHGDTVARPTNPSKSGYKFKYWAVQGTQSPYDFTTPVKGDLTLVAVYDHYVKVFFNANGGRPAPGTQTLLKGNVANKPQDPVKYGKIFVGWVLRGTDTLFDFSQPINHNTYLEAKYEDPAPVARFYTYGGNPDPGEVTLDSNGYVPRPEDPHKDGYTFLYWVLEGEDQAFDFDRSFDRDVKILAVYAKNGTFGGYGRDGSYNRGRR